MLINYMYVHIAKLSTWAAYFGQLVLCNALGGTKSYATLSMFYHSVCRIIQLQLMPPEALHTLENRLKTVA